jgi:RimJ/RimL family protein N-acetyltransferase
MSDPILRDIPDAFETSRLLVRAPQPGDGAEIAVAVAESIGELRPWMDWAQGPPPTAEQSEALAWRAGVRFRAHEALDFNAYLKETGELVAKLGVPRLDWSVPKFEIGYWIRTRFAGQGLMTEAVAGLVAFGFDVLGAQRIEIRCDPRNVKSAAVAVRLNFALEGVLRNDHRAPDGHLRDTAVYARTKKAE